MKKDFLKKAGISVLSTVLIGGALVFPSLSSANDEMYKLNTKVNVYMNAYDAKNRKNSAGKFGAGKYYVYRKFGNYINISDSPNEPGGWINPSDNVAGEEKSSKNNEVSLKTSTNEFVEISGDMLTINQNTPIYISAYDAKNSVDQRGTFFPGQYYIYREYDGAFNITKQKGVPGGWIYFDSSIKNELNVSNGLPKVSESLDGAKESLKSVEGKNTKEVSSVIKSNKFTLNKKVSGFMTAYEAENSLDAVNTVYPGEYYIYTRYNGMINVTEYKGIPGSWINPNHTKSVDELEEQLYSKENSKAEEKQEVATEESYSETEEEIVEETYVDDSSETREEVYEEPVEEIKEEPKENKKEEVKEKSSSNNVDYSSNIVDFARQFVGYNYQFGGMSPSTGFDCSGLTSYVLRNTKGIVLSRGAQGQFYGGQSVSMDNLQAGDLVFFGNSVNDIYHVGIYDGNGNVIHASTEDTGVIISNFYSDWYQNNYVGARRY